MKRRNLHISAIALSMVALLASCGTERLKTPDTPPPTPATNNASFEEEFTNAGTLTAKGWAFQNNSNPVGVTGWRQGRYESASAVQYKFLAPVAFMGFPAYSAENAPTDFLSCDVSAASDANPQQNADYSAWVISPAVPMKNGDEISFYTRASDDSQYPVYCKDRMQVRANLTDGSTFVGNGDTTVGKFTTLLLDINPNYVFNDPASGQSGGFPRAWTKYTITLSGLPPAGITKGRFAFRYLGEDAGFFGGVSGNNFPTVVGIDQVKFTSN